MCGFLAIIGHDGSDETRHEMLARVQRHRGPDGCGVYTSPRGRATLIHNRLSIIDLSSRGHQPMRSADGQLCLVFNGEIYNYKELRARLGDYPFQGSSDSEVLLAAYQQWGERALDELIGMFSFVIWDERTQSLFGARDRFGVKPFVYHLLPDGGLMVATEIKALQAAGAPAEPAAHVWATYLAHGLTDH
jgi:asparagine synthase (glutamine-hydrolysing)